MGTPRRGGDALRDASGRLTRPYAGGPPPKVGGGAWRVRPTFGLAIDDSKPDEPCSPANGRDELAKIAIGRTLSQAATDALPPLSGEAREDLQGVLGGGAGGEARDQGFAGCKRSSPVRRAA